MTRKHTKYTPEWLDITKGLVPKKNTTEKDDKGNVIDKTEIELLGDKRVELEGQITILDQEIQNKQNLNKSSAEIYSLHANVKKKATDYEAHLATNYASGHLNGQQLGTVSTNFRDGTGANHYNWDAKINNQYSKNITGGKDYIDNLYQLDIGGNNHQITEEQLVSVIARICHGLSTIDVNELKDKFKNWDTNGTNQTNFNNWLDILVDEGKLIKVKDNKGGNLKTLDFASSYTKDDNTAYTTRNVATITQAFYDWLNLAKRKLNNKTLAETLTKDNTHSETVSIYQKGDAWNHEVLKKDFGITIDKSNQTIYKTGSSSANFSVSGGIGGWINLGETISDTAGGNQVKVIRSFGAAIGANDDTFGGTGRNLTQSPQQQMFTDLRTKICNCAGGTCTNNQHWHDDFGSFGDGTSVYSVSNFSGSPSHVDELKKLETTLKHKKNVAIQKEVLTDEKIDEKKSEKTKKETEKSSLDTKIDKLVTDKITEIRTKELTKYNIKDGFEDKSNETNGKDNRKTLADLKKIKEAIEDIRYLENADDSQDSSEADENTAYTTVKELLDKWGDSRACWFDLEEGATNADKAKKIKDKNANDLQNTHDSFETWEKKVKFDDKLKQQLKDIKIALGKKEDPMDNLKTYQDKLKALNPLLTETVITEEVMKDWQTQNNFKTASTMEAELKKIFKDGALDDTFKAVMTKADSEITDVANLLTKKKAKEVITLIRRWEYDKGLGAWKDVAEADRRKKLVWTLELKDPNDDKKYLDDKELTDKEINDVLYEIATGAKTLRSEKKADETNGNEDPNSPEKMSTMKEWFGFGSVGKSLLAYGGILIVVGGLLAVIFWDSIKNWWNPKEEGSDDVAETEKEDE